MSQEVKRYPELELQKGGSFYAKIPLIERFETVVGQVKTNKEFQERLKSYADRVVKTLGLEVDRLIFDDIGLARVSVLPGQCACISITGDSREGRGSKLPEFSTHNVDTAVQYVALTSIVFFYLNRLQRLAEENSG